MNLTEIENAVTSAAEELIVKGNLKSGNIVVIGCSTSEIGGGIIGKSGSLDIAEAVFLQLFLHIKGQPQAFHAASRLFQFPEPPIRAADQPGPRSGAAPKPQPVAFP